MPAQASWLKLFYFKHSAIAIFDCNTQPVEALPLTPTLNLLLESARDYPPALACSKQDLYQEIFTEEAALLARVGERLQYYLTRQHLGEFILARAAVTDGVDFLEGGYYWITKRDSKHNTFWYVSRDYELYQAVIEDFSNGNTIISNFL